MVPACSSGSALAVRTAGPGVILSYVFASGIALLLMGCLAEMAVAHPTAGSFGVYAELYLSRWAGFAIRYTYWAAQSIAVGSEALAAAIYTQWWFPNTPAWAWVVFYSAILIFINARSVGAFGEFEYWFSMIKVSAIVAFILLGAAILFGVHQDRPIGLENFRAYGGFLPKGWTGVWLALAFVDIQLHGLGGSRGQRRRGQRSFAHGSARHAHTASASGDLLYWSHRHPGRRHSLDSDSAGTRHHRQSVRAGVLRDAHSRRRARD